jgi:hypothetical protein
MIRILKYIMKAIYASDTYSGPRMKYILALLGATLYIFITLFLLLVIMSVAIPSFYMKSRSVSLNLPSYPSAILFVVVVSFLVSLIAKEEDIKENNFTKRSLNRAINYMLIYGIGSVVIGGLILMKFVPPIH